MNSADLPPCPYPHIYDAGKCCGGACLAAPAPDREGVEAAAGRIVQRIEDAN